MGLKHCWKGSPQRENQAKCQAAPINIWCGDFFVRGRYKITHSPPKCKEDHPQVLLGGKERLCG